MIFIRLQTDTIFIAFSRLANVHIYRRKGHKNIETHPQILQDLNQICHNSAFRFGNSLQQHLGNNRTHSIHIWSSSVSLYVVTNIGIEESIDSPPDTWKTAANITPKPKWIKLLFATLHMVIYEIAMKIKVDLLMLH